MVSCRFLFEISNTQLNFFITSYSYQLRLPKWWRGSLFPCSVVDFYRPQTKFAKVMFLHLFVSHSVHRGGHAWLQGGMCGCRRHAWLGGNVWLQGGMHGCGGMHGWRGGMHGCGGWAWLQGACVVVRGACMVVGACMLVGSHVWLQGACMLAGGVWLGRGACMVAGGHAWWQGGMHGIWWDTVNEWVVRILLECILVWIDI